MTPRQGLHIDDSGTQRCSWCTSDPLYLRYHDREWGFPVLDDTRLFEKICLEGFQAGLSWLTILRKRENFRDAFAGFEVQAVATFTTRDVNRLLRNAGIIRHRGKIESTITNARRALELIDECGSLAAYVWQFEPRPAMRERRLTWKQIVANPISPQSIAMSKDMKKRGWSFVGPTTIYAFMQAMGLVNDHITGCAIRESVNAAYKRAGKQLRSIQHNPIEAVNRL